MLFELFDPSGISLVHLEHGMLDGAVVCLGRAGIAWVNREVPGGREDWTIWKQSQVGNLLGGDDLGVVSGGEDLKHLLARRVSLSCAKRAYLSKRGGSCQDSGKKNTTHDVFFWCSDDWLVARLWETKIMVLESESVLVGRRVVN